MGCWAAARAFSWSALSVSILSDTTSTATGMTAGEGLTIPFLLTKTDDEVDEERAEDEEAGVENDWDEFASRIAGAASAATTTPPWAETVVFRRVGLVADKPSPLSVVTMIVFCLINLRCRASADGVATPTPGLFTLSFCDDLPEVSLVEDIPRGGLVVPLGVETITLCSTPRCCKSLWWRSALSS